MRTDELEFEGTTYTCRVVESADGEDLLIGSTELLDALQPGSFEDANEGFANKEAEDIYDEVFYFTEPQNLLLPDKELIALLKKQRRTVRKSWVAAGSVVLGLVLLAVSFYAVVQAAYGKCFYLIDI